MARIPLAALRQALAEMIHGAGSEAGNAFHGSHIDRGIVAGAAPGLVGGALTGANLRQDNGDTAAAPLGIVGMLGGAALGGGGGMAVKLARMAERGVGGGARGFGRGLREALAERMAPAMGGADLPPTGALASSMGADDASRFAAGVQGRDVPLVQDMQDNPDMHAPYSRGDNPTDQMNELGAARRILARLKGERRTTTDSSEAKDLDEQISALNRMLGID